MSETSWPTDATDLLPDDGYAGTLVGRAGCPPSADRASWRSGRRASSTCRRPSRRCAPSPNRPTRRRRSRRRPARCIGDARRPRRRTRRPSSARRGDRPWLLSPIDLHVVKAAGVTFPVSMLERVIEERARGDQDAAGAIRAEIHATIGGSLDTLRPGSAEAADLKAFLLDRGWWSQYLEVGIGPDAEVFTKAPVLSTVGTCVDVGVLAALGVEQPRARGRARRGIRRTHRRREPRQRRQPARHRGPQRAAARQGQGQQRVGRGRPVPPPVRRGLRPRRRCRVVGGHALGRRRRRVPARRHERAGAHQPRSHRARGGR